MCRIADFLDAVVSDKLLHLAEIRRSLGEQRGNKGDE